MKLSIYFLNIVFFILEVVKLFEVGFVSKNIQLFISCEDEYIQILGDNLCIKQVINNLLSNVFKFIFKGGMVYVCGRREYFNYILCVKDNGKGMIQEQVVYVFECFY